MARHGPYDGDTEKGGDTSKGKGKGAGKDTDKGSDCGCDCGDFTADHEDEAYPLCCSCTCCGPARCDANGNAELHRQCTVRVHPIVQAMSAIERGISLQEDAALRVPVLCGDCSDHEHTVRLRAAVKSMQAKRRRARGEVDWEGSQPTHDIDGWLR
jgi:hypothetical protein